MSILLRFKKERDKVKDEQSKMNDSANKKNQLIQKGMQLLFDELKELDKKKINDNGKKYDLTVKKNMATDSVIVDAKWGAIQKAIEVVVSLEPNLREVKYAFAGTRHDLSQALDLVARELALLGDLG